MANRLTWYNEFLKKEKDFNESFEEFFNVQAKTEISDNHFRAISKRTEEDERMFNERDGLQKEIENSGFGTRERLEQASDKDLKKAEQKYNRLGELLEKMQGTYEACTEIMKK